MKIWLIQLKVLLLIVFLLAPAQSYPGDETRHRRTLSGVPCIHVLVEEISDSLQQAGMSTTMLQTDAELRLRAAGIRVASEEQSFALPGSPYLYVKVTGLRDTTTKGKLLGYSADIEIQLVQDVRLERDASIKIGTPTWSLEEIVGGPTVEIIRSSVRDLTDRFANAYLSANPIK